MVAGYTIGSYRVGQTLGVGTFGKVKLAVHEKTEINVAIKIVNKAKMQAMDMHEKVQREIAIMRYLRHPHVIRLYEIIDTPTDLFLVMDYIPGGELFDYIVQHSRLSESCAKKLFQQLICGVRYCHQHSVCHRDLKPENILLDSVPNIKVGDFGLSNFMKDGEFLKTSCGSPNYASPEVVSGKSYYGEEVDVWSCGVVLYALLCGSLPFDDENVPNLFKKIRSGIFAIPGHISDLCKNLLLKMLDVDPLKRIGFREIQNHPWYTSNLPFSLSTTALRLAMKPTIDPYIVKQLLKLGYEFDPQKLPLDPIPSTNMSEASVAYQLIADKATNHRNGVINQPFAFARHIQKRIAQASHYVNPDVTPFQWDANANSIAENLATYLNMRSLLHDTAFEHRLSHTTRASHRTTEKPVMNRWSLGIQVSMNAATIFITILKVLKKFDYEWSIMCPYRIQCRKMATIKKIFQCTCSHDKHSMNDCIHSDTRNHKDYIYLLLQLYTNQPGQYIIDLQLYDGPTLLCINEAVSILGKLSSIFQKRDT